MPQKMPLLSEASTSKASFSVARNKSCSPPSKNGAYRDNLMILEEREGIIYDAIVKCFPNLDYESITVSPLKGPAQEKLGDYTCTNILTIYEGLRRLDPCFLEQVSSRDIARKVLEAIEKNKENTMITELKLHDAGFLTFRLSWTWMTEKIKEMLIVGIDLWAPAKVDKLVVIDGPELVIGPDVYAEEIRSRYIREMLICMLDYSGVAVSTGILNDKSRNALQDYFTEEPGVMTSIRHGTPLFAGKSEDLAKKFRVDLQALWSAIYELKVEFIVYVTSVREREYVNKCFDVVKSEGWLSAESNPKLSCRGYRTSSVERQKLAHLWTIFENQTDSKVSYLVELGTTAGYTPEASMECAIKYTYLKTHRLAECTLNIDEMLDEEGNTFVYLLKTRLLISSLVQNGGGGIMDKYSKAKHRKEHELAVHLVQFTEVIEKASFAFLLHHVCDYLSDLCKKFKSYYSEVTKLMDFLELRTFFLCDATKVVMDKCFHLLGITSASSRRSSRYASTKELGVEVIPRPVSVASAKNLNPRFELFRMNVCVADSSFSKGYMHGIVSCVDTDGLLSDGRLPLNKRGDHGHVAYLYREWYDPVGICDNGYVYFKNPTPSHLVPFSSELEIFVKLFVTTEDKCFHMCLGQQPLDLSKMWKDKPPSHIRGTLEYNSDNGSTSINYIALRDAVDTTMKLSLMSPGDPLSKLYVSGYILASYGKMLDDLDDLGRGGYKAIIFKAGEDGKLKVGPISLQKSVMAVPVKGTLILEARFLDKSGNVIYNEKRTFKEQKQVSNEWCMPLKKLRKGYFLKLEVEWSRGPKSSYC